jgi:hypothetical protein
MSGPGFTWPNLCSIRAAVGLAKPARAVRGLYNADGFPLADDAPFGGACLVASRRGRRTEAGR